LWLHWTRTLLLLLAAPRKRRRKRKKRLRHRSLNHKVCSGPVCEGADRVGSSVGRGGGCDGMMRCGVGIYISFEFHTPFPVIPSASKKSKSRLLPTPLHRRPSPPPITTVHHHNRNGLLLRSQSATRRPGRGRERSRPFHRPQRLHPPGSLGREIVSCFLPSSASSN
jgi:hypothetical protein